MMAADITSREDIQLLVESFYKRVREDENAGPDIPDLTHFRWDTTFLSWSLSGKPFY